MDDFDVNFEGKKQVDGSYVYFEMAKIEGIDEFLKESLNAYLLQHFSAADDRTRYTIEGKFNLIKQMLEKIKETRLTNK